ncbi:MAG: RNA methyltransferase [Betaproteobacteria bacterium]
MNSYSASMATMFERTRFVLVETSHPANVGSAARAMKTMGFSDLVLVNPCDPDAARHEEAIALASGAHDVLASARIAHSLEEALTGCNFSVALSARPREFSPPLFEPRQLSAHLAADASLRAALVFGSERYGLSNEQVGKCSALVSVPANPMYSSLNLAQAVQLIAYECRLAGMGEVRSERAVGFHGERASAEQIEGMFAHLEKALVEIDFLDADNPKKLMPRLRRLFARAELEIEEVNILRGIATQLISKRQRIRKD